MDVTDQTTPAGSAAPATEEQFRPGIADVVILPLVAGAFAVARAMRAAFWGLVRLLDYAFPILLQVMRFPLFTVRIIGDALVGVSKAIIRLLPVSLGRRREWVDSVSAGWSWLRRKISYKAFEEAVHHLFEDGMAWVFRRCRTLTPRAALLVIFGAALWLPISFGIATAMHALLIAYAASLPPWMQLLHPFATVIAKSKLLVVPAYPAAWPQAKRHPMVQSLAEFYRTCTRLYLARKTRARYRQTEVVAATLAGTVERSTIFAGLARLWDHVSSAFAAGLAGLARMIRSAVAWTVGALARMPLIGPAIGSYAAHYDRAAQRDSTAPLSERVQGFFERWSIKFTAQYYEAKEQENGVAREHVA